MLGVEVLVSPFAAHIIHLEVEFIDLLNFGDIRSGTRLLQMIDNIAQDSD